MHASAEDDRPDRWYGRAYGNVGGVLFLTVLSFVSTELFFVAIAGVSVLAFVPASFLDEPKGYMVEVDERGRCSGSRWSECLHRPAGA